MASIFKLDNHLNKDEKILYFFRPSRKAYLFHYIFYIILLAASIFYAGYRVIGSAYFIFWNYVNIVAILVFIYAVIMILRTEYRIWSRKYALTDQRAIYCNGIFSEEFKSCQYKSITDITMDRTLWDKILHTGTIFIDTAGTDSVEIRYREVNDPMIIQKIISEHQRKK